MTDEERTALQEQLVELDKASGQIGDAMQPFRDALAAIDGVREALLTRHNVEIAGQCEGCERLLFVGDMGHRCEDGPMLCAECSPIYADVLKQARERLGEGDQDVADTVTALEQRLADGSIDDKALHEL